jgi:hypothetical protein
MRNGNGVAKLESKKTNGSTVRRVVRVRVVLARLRRALLPKGLTIIMSRPVLVRGKRGYPDDVGRFFVVREKEIVEHHVDLDAFARRHGVVKEWEEIEEHRNASPPSRSDDGGRVQKRA